MRFEQPQYTFSEGIGQGSVCLRKDLATAETVTVSVRTMNGSALSEYISLYKYMLQTSVQLDIQCRFCKSPINRLIGSNRYRNCS